MRRALPLLLLAACAAAAAAHTLKSELIRCFNEGEPVPLGEDLNSCFHCICKDGFVKCHMDEKCGPMEECAVVLPAAAGAGGAGGAGGAAGAGGGGRMRAHCKPCWYNGTAHASHTEWGDDGRVLRCEAGVVTVSRPECYAPCARPKHQRHPHYNCPFCDQCILNGQRVGEDREVRVPEEPCLSCRCVLGALTCVKRACPVLPCSRDAQHTPTGECCPRCSHPTADKLLPGHAKKPCIIGKEFHAHLSPFRVDPCTDCVCLNGTAVCSRHTCPVLTCGARVLPPQPGKCCPQCPHIAEAKAACIIGGKTYEDGETWQLDACKSCECHGGEPRCAMERCPALLCAPDQTLRRLPAQCCAKCVDMDGICTVFGDPHYKTFDGKFYSFQGSCKYQMVSDCVNNTFSIRISNDARNTSHSSWTRTATLRIGPSKINLGKKMRIKVNGERVTLPHTLQGVAHIARSNGSVLLRADVGVQMLWDGDGFLEVTVSSAYKGKVCGLCGNFNSIAKDDLTTREGKLVNDTWRYGTSWRVGGRHACTRAQERPSGARCRRSRLRRARRLCEEFELSDVFTECRLRVNPENYRLACIRDACGCEGARCHCAAYRAYARECERAGAALPAWARAVWCEGGAPAWLARRARGRRRGGGRRRQQLLEAVAGATTPKSGRSRPALPILR